MNLLRLSLLFFFLFLVISGKGQNSASDLLDEMSENQVNFTEATFKASRIINGHSIEQPAKGEMDFRISHRFGQISGGLYEYFGLDEGTIHFSFEYSPVQRLTIGVGRSNYHKTYDGFAKVKILRQKSGKENFPFSLSAFASFEANTLKNEIPNYEIKHRFGYAYQFLIARKFGEFFSFQLTPTLVHKNLVESPEVPNDFYSVGIGGRIKITKRLTFNAEWFPVFNLSEGADFTNTSPFSIGFDLETGGHVFQILLTNSQAMREVAFISDTHGSWLDGDIHLGFNISRVFNLHD